MLLFFMTLLLLGAGISASFAITKLTGDEPLPKPEPTTRFYVMNESEIYFGKPAFYRTIVENQEGNATDYELKVKLAGEELYGEVITLNQSDVFNQTISFIPDRAGDYQKLELKVSKGSVNRGDAVYIASANKEGRIIFLGEAYEKILPGTANLLLPVRMELQDKKLKINESIALNDGYAVKLKNIQNDSLYISIYKNNITQYGDKKSIFTGNK